MGALQKPTSQLTTERLHATAGELELSGTQKMAILSLKMLSETHMNFSGALRSVIFALMRSERSVSACRHAAILDDTAEKRLSCLTLDSLLSGSGTYSCRCRRSLQEGNHGEHRRSG